MIDPLAIFSHLLPIKDIQDLRTLKLAELKKISHWDKYLQLKRNFTFPTNAEINTSDIVSIRYDKGWEEENKEQITQLIAELLPWRKGPFNFLGQEIDAEWQSNLKWDRIAQALPELSGKRIVDIGCGNGYYLLRLLEHSPRLVVGLDPSSRAYYQFKLLTSAISNSLPLTFELFGIEDLGLFPEFFHVALCLGVIYHRRDPYTACRQLYETLKPGGTLLIESLIYPGDEAVALCPPGRYAMMRNVWFIPTVSTMEIWLSKAGFIDIELIDLSVTTVVEQRKTKLAPYDSLKDFLSPQDPTITVEGHPAPQRAILKARRA